MNKEVRARQRLWCGVNVFVDDVVPVAVVKDSACEKAREGGVLSSFPGGWCPGGLDVDVVVVGL